MSRPKSTKQSSALGTKCPYDGATLDEQGYCWQGNGYPVGMKCPFVCPRCHAGLAWDGGCNGCLGTGETKRAKQDRKDWFFPGWRYAAVKWHWVKSEEPGPAMPYERVMQLSTMIQEIAAPPVVTP